MQKATFNRGEYTGCLVFSFLVFFVTSLIVFFPTISWAAGGNTSALQQERPLLAQAGGGGGGGGSDDTASGGLVPCSGPVEGDECDYAAFMTLVNNLINWLIRIAVAISSILFAYAGFLYLSAGGKKSQAKQAKKIFGNVAIGFVIILIAWLAVSAVVRLLTTDEWRDENQDVVPINLSLEKNIHENIS